MPKQPPEPRHTVERFPGGVRIVLPSEKKVLKIIWFGFMSLYSLAFVGMGGFIFITMLIALWNEYSSSAEIYWNVMIPVFFLLIFLIFSLMFSGAAIYSFLWQTKGREIIEVNKNSTLSVYRQLLHWRPVDEYLVKDIKDLRAIEQNFSIRHSQVDFWKKLRHKNGSIAFDYGAKTYRFGEDIDPAEAKMMIAVLQEFL